MIPLVSAIIPTRGRPEGLAKTIYSMLNTTLTPGALQVVLKADDDDPTPYEQQRYACGAAPLGYSPKVVRSPRGLGYLDMPRFVGEACDKADGEWCFLIDDDSWIEGYGWDTQLAAITSKDCAAQCEFYNLGQSKYGSNSCGPNGLFVPTYIARQIPRTTGAADVALLGLTVGHGMPKHLLRGITYCHDGRPR